MTKEYTQSQTVPRSLFNVVLAALFLVSGLAIYDLFFHHAVANSANIARANNTSQNTLPARAEQSTTVASENNSSAKEPVKISQESRNLAAGKTIKKKINKQDETPAPAVAYNADTKQVVFPLDEEKDSRKIGDETDSFDYFTRYKVRGKAYIHTEPDERTRRPAFITHWNNAIIKPLDEQNGFIYIIFTNYEGVTSRGWLSKADLIRVN